MDMMYDCSVLTQCRASPQRRFQRLRRTRCCETSGLCGANCTKFPKTVDYWKAALRRSMALVSSRLTLEMHPSEIEHKEARKSGLIHHFRGLYRGLARVRSLINNRSTMSPVHILPKGRRSAITAATVSNPMKFSQKPERNSLSNRSPLHSHEGFSKPSARQTSNADSIPSIARRFSCLSLAPQSNLASSFFSTSIHLCFE